MKNIVFSGLGSEKETMQSCVVYIFISKWNILYICLFSKEKK